MIDFIIYILIASTFFYLGVLFGRILYKTKNQNKDNTVAVSSETGWITKDALDNPIGIGKNAGKQNKDEKK